MIQNTGRRVVDGDTLIQAIRSELAAGGHFTLTVTGSSMEPFLHNGSSHVLLKRPEELRRWQVVFYRRDNGRYILHRIVRIRGDEVTVCGDAQQQPERIHRDQILAAAVWICEKDNDWVEWGSFRHQFRSALWHFLRPLRPYLLRLLRR